MAEVLIVYATDYGNTKKMADAVSDGARSVPNTNVHLLEAESVSKEITLKADAIIIGTPVHMGSPDWRIKKFIDTVCSSLWMEDKLIGKIGGVFTAGGGFGSAGGGCELTMLSLMSNFAELGMVIIPLPKSTPGYAVAGLQWGPYGRSMGTHMEYTGISKECLETSFHHGANIARIAGQLKNGHHLFAKAEATVKH